MKNFKIGVKLVVTFGAVILLFCITVVLSLLSVRSLRDDFNSFYHEGYQVTNYAMDMRRAIQATAENLGYATMTTDREKSAYYIQKAEEELDSLRSGVAYMREHFPGDMALVNNFESVMSSVIEQRDQVFQLAIQNRNEEAAELYFKDVLPAFDQAREYLLEINRIASGGADSYYARAEKEGGSITVLLVAISAIALAVTGILALYITRSLTRPIKEIEEAATKMGEGNLDIVVSYRSKDELGSLSDKIRHLTETLKTIISDEDYILGEMASGNLDIYTQHENIYVGKFREILLSMRKINVSLSHALDQINKSADQVATGSDQVASGAQALSQGAAEQASSVEELAATFDEISERVNRNAQHANQANMKSAETGEQVLRCNQSMQAMLQAMNEITASSNEIGKVMADIEDITFQTNILALNAAVEAAHAGAAGKGFAVVADEVRRLAAKSSEASENIAMLIKSSLQSVGRGARIADDTAQALSDVVEGAKIVTAAIDKISEASNEQASSIKQVTEGIDQISKVVQTNSATAEESAAASEELLGQAQTLKALVGQFKLKGSGAV